MAIKREFASAVLAESQVSRESFNTQVVNTVEAFIDSRLGDASWLRSFSRVEYGIYYWIILWDKNTRLNLSGQSAPIPTSFTGRDIEEIERRYKAAGWFSPTLSKRSIGSLQDVLFSFTAFSKPVPKGFTVIEAGTGLWSSQIRLKTKTNLR